METAVLVGGDRRHAVQLWFVDLGDMPLFPSSLCGLVDLPLGCGICLYTVFLYWTTSQDLGPCRGISCVEQHQAQRDENTAILGAVFARGYRWHTRFVYISYGAVV